MELPEETFVNIHGFDAKGETYSQYNILCLSSSLRPLTTLVSPLSPLHEIVSGVHPPISPLTLHPY